MRPVAPQCDGNPSELASFGPSNRLPHRNPQTITHATKRGMLDILLPQTRSHRSTRWHSDAVCEAFLGEAFRFAASANRCSYNGITSIKSGYKRSRSFDCDEMQHVATRDGVTASRSDKVLRCGAADLASDSVWRVLCGGVGMIAELIPRAGRAACDDLGIAFDSSHGWQSRLAGATGLACAASRGFRARSEKPRECRRADPGDGGDG
jgi:hypothetical protein